MSRFFASMSIAVAMTIGIASEIGISEYTNRSSSVQESPIVIKTKNIAFPRNQNEMLIKSPSLLFLHLLKYKPHQKLEKISTTPSTRDCICVPFYLCNSNQTVITDGAGVIDIRSRKCIGDYEVCCYPPNVTGSSTAPIVISTALPIPTILPIPTTFPTIPPNTSPATTSTTSSTTLPPIIFPIGSPNSPVTVFPHLNCVCVEVSQCDPNGIITISGESLINPRQGYALCSGANQVCCKIVVTQPPTSSPTSMTPTAATSVLPEQVCFVCGNTIQCIACGIVTTPGSSTIDPRFPSPRDRGNPCSAKNLPCQGTTFAPSVNFFSFADLLGPLKNAGTAQACYCVKSWLCSENNVIPPDGLGIIDSRFTGCPSADQVCCRSTGIDLQAVRSADASSRVDVTVDISSFGLSSSRNTCGTRNDTYAPPQSFPADSGKTYFAEFPWMVALLLKPAANGPYVFQCGASMINNRAILTAAHCVVDKKSEDLAARFGQWNIDDKTQPPSTQEANILAAVIHPSYYKGGLFHDIAVLVLDKEIVYDVNVMPICLPDQSTIFTPGTRCYGTGWGQDSFESEGKYRAELRKVELPIVDHTDCQTRLRTTRLGQHFQLHGSFICAGGEASRDTCRGDGGGPLACQAVTGQFFQAGIVSWGIGCGTSNIPAVYTSVSVHRQWIDKQLATYGVH